MGRKKNEKSNANRIAKKDSENARKRDHNKFLDDKMKELFVIIDDNIDVFKRLKDK